jgi:hypothetical protein
LYQNFHCKAKKPEPSFEPLLCWALGADWHRRLFFRPEDFKKVKYKNANYYPILNLGCPGVIKTDNSFVSLVLSKIGGLGQSRSKVIQKTFSSRNIRQLNFHFPVFTLITLNE